MSPQSDLTTRSAATPDRALTLSLCLPLGALLLLLAAGQTVSAGPKPQKPAPQAADVVDVGILVRPVTADSAHVALAYRHPVPHAHVRKAIDRLAHATGWKPDNLLIVDDRINRDPKTTTALFTLRNAPQIVAGAPALQPYLTAFQEWNRVEVIFAQLRPEPTRAAVQFESAALAVQLAQRGPGLSRYIADIRDHTGALPVVPFTQEPTPNPQATTQASAPPSEARRPAESLLNLPLLLTILGASLIGGTMTYLAVIRRLPARSSARVLRP